MPTTLTITKQAYPDLWDWYIKSGYSVYEERLLWAKNIDMAGVYQSTSGNKPYIEFLGMNSEEDMVFITLVHTAPLMVVCVDKDTEHITTKNELKIDSKIVYPSLYNKVIHCWNDDVVLFSVANISSSAPSELVLYNYKTMTVLAHSPNLLSTFTTTSLFRSLWEDNNVIWASMHLVKADDGQYYLLVASARQLFTTTSKGGAITKVNVSTMDVGSATDIIPYNSQTAAWFGNDTHGYTWMNFLDEQDGKIYAIMGMTNTPNNNSDGALFYYFTISLSDCTIDEIKQTICAYNDASKFHYALNYRWYCYDKNVATVGPSVYTYGTLDTINFENPIADNSRSINMAGTMYRDVPTNVVMPNIGYKKHIHVGGYEIIICRCGGYSISGSYVLIYNTKSKRVSLLNTGTEIVNNSGNKSYKSSKYPTTGVDFLRDTFYFQLTTMIGSDDSLLPMVSASLEEVFETPVSGYREVGQGYIVAKL